MAENTTMDRAAEIGEGLSEASTQELLRELISRMGEDPNRQGLLATPSLPRFCAVRSLTRTTTRWSS